MPAYWTALQIFVCTANT